MVTEIPWGDGSGDLIYLSYSASEGDQTVLVSSDANGGVARTKNITFVSTVGNISRILTVSQDEQYIVFADSEVETICANTWGDGVGLKPSQAAQVTSFGTIFTGNTLITSFNEQSYFTGLTTYGNNNPGTFNACTSLVSTTIPEIGVYSNQIFERAYQNCSSLEVVTLHAEIRNGSGTSGPAYTFNGCTNLTRVNIDSVEKWMKNFWNRYAHPFNASPGGHLYLDGIEITNVVIPSTISVINPRAFWKCIGITSVIIPSSVASVDADAFADCSGLTAVTGMSGVRTLGRDAFYKCTALTSDIDLPSLTGSLPVLTFAYTAITKVVSLGSITTIQSTNSSGPFWNCSALKEVALPSTLTTVNVNAFQNCTAMEKINITDLAAYCGITFGADANPFRYSTAVSRGLYLNGELVTNLVIPSTVTAIGSSQFYKNNTITSVTIPSSVTTIGAYAFYNCTGLTGDIVVPSSVTSIGDNAFAYTTGITNLYILSTSTFTLTSINNITANTTAGTGNGTGVLQFNGGLNISTWESRLSFKKLIVKGNMSQANLLRISPSCNYIEQIRVGGNYTNTYASDAANGRILYSTGSSVASKLIFIEIMGTITSGHSILAAENRCIASSGVILHLGYNGIPCAPNIVLASSTRIAKIYVGDGSSASHDDAILAQYTADTDWSAYSSKLDTWYNYINDPNANPDYIN